MSKTDEPTTDEPTADEPTAAGQTSGKTSKYAMPGFFAGVGVVCLVAAIIGGQLLVGGVLLAIMVVVAVLLLVLRSRSETVRGLTENPDERDRTISGRAWAATGLLLTVANLGALIGSLAGGDTGKPYYWELGFIAIAYVSMVAMMRRTT